MASLNGNIVTMPLGFTATEDSSNLAVVNSDFPQDLKIALSFMSSANQSDANGISNSSIKSYSIGSKTVNYSDGGEAQNRYFESIIRKYTKRFNRTFIKSV